MSPVDQSDYSSIPEEGYENISELKKLCEVSRRSRLRSRNLRLFRQLSINLFILLPDLLILLHGLPRLRAVARRLIRARQAVMQTAIVIQAQRFFQVRHCFGIPI